VKLTGIPFLLALLLCGCGADVQSKEAIRQGVLEHLAANSSLNVESMDIEVNSVTFRDDEADAMVSFQAKGTGDPASGMMMQYTLERKGGRWVVTGRAGTDGSPHGGMGGGMGSPHGAAPPEGGLPPNHPPLEGSPNPGGGE